MKKPQKILDPFPDNFQKMTYVWWHRIDDELLIRYRDLGFSIDDVFYDRPGAIGMNVVVQPMLWAKGIGDELDWELNTDDAYHWREGTAYINEHIPDLVRKARVWFSNHLITA